MLKWVLNRLVTSVIELFLFKPKKYLKYLTQIICSELLAIIFSFVIKEILWNFLRKLSRDSKNAPYSLTNNNKNELFFLFVFLYSTFAKNEFVY